MLKLSYLYKSHNLKACLLNGTRFKVTLTAADACSTASKRPVPILLLETDPVAKWSSQWQTKLSQAGYMSTIAHLSVDSKDGPAVQLAQYYKELSNATRSLSFFPPLLVGHGSEAWRIGQKFVSNQPVSGFVLLETVKTFSQLPSSEFEPRFPMAMLTNISGSQPPEFLDGWIEHEVVEANTMLESMLQWMDNNGM